MLQAKATHIIIFLLVIAHQILGMLWYSPWLFAFQWLRLTGLSPADIDPQNLMPFAISILASTLLCYTMAWTFVLLKIPSALRGMRAGFVIWFVFLFMITLTHASFSQVPMKLILIDMSRDFLMFLLTGAVLGAWNARLSQKGSP